MKKNFIKTGVYCNHENLKKYLPAQYVVLVSKCYYGENANLICFSADKNAVTSSEIIKARKKIDNVKFRSFYFARCFTVEAIKIITENNDAAFYLNDFPWFDERYNIIRGGKAKF